MGTNWWLILVLFVLLAFLTAIFYVVQRTLNRHHYLVYLPPIGAVFLGCWLVVVVFGWEAHALMWLNLLIRWAHVLIGILWIGTSFYFIFLENSLNRTKGLRDELAGNLWAIHGGGFYYLEKYKIAPAQLPDKLHWFKYEAYFTWITGFILLFIVYYSNINLYLADPEVVSISSGMAVALGIGSLVIGWIIYDLLCKSQIARREYLFTFIAFVLTCLAAYLFSLVFNGKAAYIHVGALLGTLMAGNVFMVIIPSQKAMVRAAQTGFKKSFQGFSIGRNQSSPKTAMDK